MASVVRLPNEETTGFVRFITWLAYHLLSFELVFALYLYSNEIKMFLGWLPADETVIFGGLSILVGALVILKEGLYVRGLLTLAAGLLFIGWAVITASWTPSIELVDRTLTYLLTFNLWCIVAGALIIANRRERATRFLCFVITIALCLTVMGLYIYFAYGTFRQWEGWQDVGIRRVYLNWGYTVADGTAVILCIALFARFGTFKQVLAMALFATCVFFLLVGGGRAPFLGVVLACLLAFVLNPPIIGQRRFDLPVVQILAVGIFAVVVAYVTYLFTTDQMTTTLGRFIKAFDEFEDSSVASGPSRVYYWPAAIKFWLQEPWVGNGLASFSVLFRAAEIQGSHPHNFILEILAEQGLVGLLLFLLFVWSAARQVTIRRLRLDPLLLAVVMIATTTAMSGLFAKDLAGGKRVFFMLSLLTLRPPAASRLDDAEEDEEEDDPDRPPRRRRPHPPTVA